MWSESTLHRTTAPGPWDKPPLNGTHYPQRVRQPALQREWNCRVL